MSLFPSLMLGLLLPWGQNADFTFRQDNENITILFGDNTKAKPVATFVTGDKATLRPYLANLHGPNGSLLTRSHPPVPGKDPVDHQDMHPGLWLAFGDINGSDFWRNKADIRFHKWLKPPAVTDGILRFSARHDLVPPGGNTLGTLDNSLEFRNTPSGHLVIWDATFTAGDQPLVLGDQEEMGFGARLATPLIEKNGGKITNSFGKTTAKATWGQPADWTDYSGKAGDRSAGITLMASPQNFRKSWWHNRDYGLMVANPFGRAAMKQGNKSAVVVEPGQTLRLVFGALLHEREGYEPARAYADFLAAIQKTSAFRSQPDSLPWIAVSPNKKGFVQQLSGKPFAPWGVNYDHDDSGRLIEDYWDKEWSTIEGDFAEMRQLGANVIRIHLQVGKFMAGPDKPNEHALGQLKKLVALAEKTGLYLDLTGLACYHKKDVPAWYDALDEEGRWAAQAAFWTAIASVCADSPAIFCYDLMNEPVVPGGKRKPADWLGPAFGDKHFVQVISLDQKNRPRPDIARLWINHLVTAIRKVDQRHLITVGQVDWSLDRPGLTSGFVPQKVTEKLDFLCVHLYPKSGKTEEDLQTLRAFATGLPVPKPVVVEETFPLQCSPGELEQFIRKADGDAAGWISFYWGKPPEELRRGKTIVDKLLLQWLEIFARGWPKN